MPQNIRDSSDVGGGNSAETGGKDEAAIGAAALERLRSMLVTPVQNRSPDWVNPLEKIEQLLTCSICLDRYKNPKLLPCQHTFCMEPCLDGLIDLVRRMVRCPECRAEHPLPYDGLKNFQTNYTLMGFLEIHLQATEENAGDFEAYIRRYNLERCKICDEKAEVDYCPHCEKRICLECKSTHADMLKRDLGRLMNQVKRACTRIMDSSDTLARGVESLNVNCENIKEEVRDYTRRYVKEMKKREETLINEVDAFYSGETRMINTVRDNLELEAKNMNEACARVESCLKGEKELTDEELVRYKTMFTEGLDYLRMSNPDADELINKKLRFVVTDAHMLPHAILQFGELQVCTPQFNHKFVQAEKMYVPRFLQLGMESEHYPGKKRLDQMEMVPSWKQKPSTTTQADDDAYSSRYRRRQLLEEQAWNRIRIEQEQQPQIQSTRRSPRSSALEDILTGTSPTRNANLDVVNPWTRTRAAANDPNSETITVVAGATESSSPISFNTNSSPQMQPRRQHRTDASSSNTDHATEGDDLDQRVANIRREYEDGISRLNQKRLRNRTTPVDIATASGGAESSGDDEEENEEDGENHESIPIQMLPKLDSSQVAKVQQNVVVAAARPLQVDTSSDAHTSRDQPNRPTVDTSSNVGGSDWRKYLIPSPAPQGRQRSSTVAADLTSGMELPTMPAATATTRIPDRGELRSSSSRDSIAGDGSSTSWDERRRQFIRSRTNPDLNSENGTEVSSYDRRRHRNRADSFGSGGGSNDEAGHHGTGTRSEREAEQRKNRYRRKAERSHSAYVGAGNGEENQDIAYWGLDGRLADAAQRFEISIQGNTNGDAASSPTVAGTGGGRLYRVFTQPKIDYLSKGRCLVKFGAKGNQEGQFNWPRGVAIIPTTEEIAICDSSNHRMQIFDKRGRLVKTIGSYGSGRGEFDCLADVGVNRHKQFVVTDRYNHRVQIFDANGRFLREFGAHGQTNGRFNNPWGVVVDQQGFIYVCDKDNHRVQIFQADGNFVGKFGGIGNREGQFQNPHFIACNRQNQLIITDSSNHRIQVFDHNGHFLFMFGSEGFHEGQFKYPRGVAVDEQGFIIVADSGNNRIQVFYPDGRFYVTFACWGNGDGQLKGVEGVAVTNSGQIVCSDRENHRIQIF